MIKKAPIIGAVVVVALTVALFYGANAASGEEGEEDGGLLGIRVPFVTLVLAVLAFVAGFAFRDVLGRKAARPRPPAAGRKPS